MISSSLPLFELLAPTLIVAGIVYALPPALPMSRSWARWLIFATVWAVVARYHYWRLFTTVLPVEGAWYEAAWVWLCYAVEVFAVFDAFILYMAFLRHRDRTAEADAHEQRLRHASSPLPSVDVYIPTYNEDLEVLEKTITGALCLDYPNFKVWVLDDGRRVWLQQFCEEKGVGYITRPSNEHAKAGNINHALKHTDSDFVAIFDADFVPQRQFLMRTMGFFDDPQIGIVQVPHAFYNNDPLQTNLALQKSLPDDQRFFFEAIMPSRDGWDAAFCCGSNSVTRRSALRAVGDALPTGSITEDMLLSLALLRKGYVTRYLCERLAYGLAPESLQAFFIQRQRWARGATQILFLADGPLGRNLRLAHRLLFLPTHWLSQSLMMLTTILAPLIFLWTGLTPLINVDTESVVNYIIPMVLAIIGGICAFAPGQYFPLASQVLGTFQSFKILPTVLATLVKPFGYVFQVTPKGAAAKLSTYETRIFWIAATLIVLTLAGLLINLSPEYHIVTQVSLLPMIAIWCAINITVLFLVCMMSLQAPARRTEERFEIAEPVSVTRPGGSPVMAMSLDMSLSGIAFGAANASVFAPGEHVSVFISQVGTLAATVARVSATTVGARFDLPASIERDLLISKLFTQGHNTADVTISAGAALAGMLTSIVNLDTAFRQGAAAEPEAVAADVRKLPAMTSVVAPRAARSMLADLGRDRQQIAA